MAIRCGHCGNKHESVAAVRRCGQTGGHASTRVVQPVTVAKPGPATVGMYRKLGQIYRVATGRQSGRLYAQRLDRVATADGTDFRYVAAPGMATRLTQADRMDVDEAKAFGDVTTRCIRCLAVLTDPASVTRGMGLTCSQKI